MLAITPTMYTRSVHVEREREGNKMRAMSAANIRLHKANIQLQPIRIYCINKKKDVCAAVRSSIAAALFDKL